MMSHRATLSPESSPPGAASASAMNQFLSTLHHLCMIIAHSLEGPMDNKAMQLLQLLRVAADSSAQRVSQLNGGQKTGEWGPPRTAEFFEVLHAKLCGQFPKYFSFRTLIQIEKLKL